MTDNASYSWNCSAEGINTASMPDGGATGNNEGSGMMGESKKKGTEPLPLSTTFRSEELATTQLYRQAGTSTSTCFGQRDSSNADIGWYPESRMQLKLQQLFRQSDTLDVARLSATAPLSLCRRSLCRFHISCLSNGALQIAASNISVCLSSCLSLSIRRSISLFLLGIFLRGDGKSLRFVHF